MYEMRQHTPSPHNSPIYDWAKLLSMRRIKLRGGKIVSNATPHGCTSQARINRFDRLFRFWFFFLFFYVDVFWDADWWGWGNEERFFFLGGKDEKIWGKIRYGEVATLMRGEKLFCECWELANPDRLLGCGAFIIGWEGFIGEKLGETLCVLGWEEKYQETWRWTTNFEG